MRKNLQMILTLALVVLFGLGAAAQPKSGYYKIQNLKTQKYVDVKSASYAKPDVDEADASVIYVGIGEAWTIDPETGLYKAAADGGVPDGSYKVTSLSGEGVQVYSYVNYCVQLAFAFIDVHLTDPSKVSIPLTDEEVELAKQTIQYYADNEAFMRVEATGASYFAKATVPAIPQWVEDAAYEHGVRDGAWNWAVRQVLSRLDRLGEFGIGGFRDLIENNLPNIVPGTTYYLTADDDNTFGYVTEDEYNALSRSEKNRAKWNMNPVETYAFAESGYYRIKNAAGVDGKAYVNVDGRYTAEPDATAEEATTEPGTVIYVGMEGMPGSKTKITGLSAQSDDVIFYANKAVNMAYDAAIQVINNVAETTTNSNTRAIAEMLPGIFETYMNESMDLYGYLYLVPTMTSNNEDAVYCQLTMPDMKRLADQFASMNPFTDEQPGNTIRQEFPDFFITTNLKSDGTPFPEGVEKIIGIDTLNVLNFAVDKLIEYLDARGSDAALRALVRNHLHNVKTGHTYILSQDPDGTFGYYDICDEQNGGARDEALLAEVGDRGKWVLEPVKNDGNYFAVDPTVSGTDENGDTKYMTTLYTDFPYTLSEGMKAYKVTGAEAEESTGKYVITKEEIAGTVPAYTAVLIISDNAGVENNKLEPVAPAAEETPVEPSGAPRKAKSTDYDANAGNLMYADHFNGNAPANKALLGLGSTEDGAAFCAAVNALDGNVAVLDITNLDPADAYYIFPVEKQTETAIEAINGKAVASVKYVNIAGLQSDKAFDGVNIVVTTYNDGTQVVTKVIR